LTNLPGTKTTNTNPNGNNIGNGITGNSGGIWVQETMDLTPYVGKKILIGFRFVSDAAVNEEGMYIDDITVTGGYSDDAETPPEIRTLSVNVTYPRLTILNPTDPLTSASTLQYDQYVQKVEMQEELGHPGTYTGYFKYDPFASKYSGRYIVNFEATINGEQVIGSTTFDTTIFGCQECHNKIIMVLKRALFMQTAAECSHVNIYVTADQEVYLTMHLWGRPFQQIQYMCMK